MSIFSEMEAGFKIWLEQQKAACATHRRAADASWMDFVVDASVVMAKAAHAADPNIDANDILKKAVKLGSDAMDLDMEWISAAEGKLPPQKRRDMSSKFSRCLGSEDQKLLVGKYLEYWPWGKNQITSGVYLKHLDGDGGRLRSEQAPKWAPELDCSLVRLENLRQFPSKSAMELAGLRRPRLDAEMSLAAVDKSIVVDSKKELSQARGWLSRVGTLDRKAVQEHGEVVWSMFERGALMGTDAGYELSSASLDAMGEAKKWSDMHLAALFSMRGCQSLRLLAPAVALNVRIGEQVEQALSLCERLAQGSGDTLAVAECAKARTDLRVVRMGEDDFHEVLDLLGDPKDSEALCETLRHRVTAALDCSRAPKWMLEDAARLHRAAEGFGPETIHQSRESMCELLAGLGGRGDERAAWLMACAKDDGLGAAVAAMGEAMGKESQGTGLFEQLSAPLGSPRLDAVAKSLRDEIAVAKGQFLAIVEAAAISANIGRVRSERKARARL